jgi:hypothetical protein
VSIRYTVYKMVLDITVRLIAIHQARILLIIYISFVWASCIYKDRQFDNSLLSTTAARTSSSETLKVILQRLSPC